MEEQTARAEKILTLLEARYPKARTALNFNNPFELLVAVILSAQCTDRQVNKVTKGLFQKIKGPEDLARLDLEEIEELIRGCGLYRTKARNLKLMAEKICREFQGEVPRNLADLLKLPGVGRKTANVILSCAFDKPALAVDTHVFRLAHRLGLSFGRNPHQVEEDLRRVIPPYKWSRAHHLFIAHGRNVCRARRPLCQDCFLAALCPSFPPENSSNHTG